MAMTPDEIRSTSFPTVKKGGLDHDAVATYLTSIADEVQSLTDTAAEALAEVETARNETAAALSEAEAARNESPEEVASTTRIAVVGTHVDEVLEAAQRSADAIVRDAEEWASTHRVEADAYADQQRSQVDELRRTTEAQAESFRDETVAYANKIREDAEATAAEARAKAEADAQAQCEHLTAEATNRLQEVQTAERELLARLDVTADELAQAREHFAAAVDSHSEITPTIFTPSAPAKAEVEDVEPVEVEPTQDNAEAAETDDVGYESDDDAEVVDTEADAWGGADEDTADWGNIEDPHGDTEVEDTHDEDLAEWASAEDTESDVEDTVSTSETEGVVDSEDDEPAWAPVEASEEPETSSSWASADEEDAWTPADPDDVWGSEDEAVADDVWASADEDDADSEVVEEVETEEAPSAEAWAPDESTEDVWGSADDGVDEQPVADDGWNDEPAGDTVPAWTPSGATDPWASEANAETETVGSVATTDQATASAEADPSFFEESEDAAPEADEGDPLAAMVRQAVERVTDGDGAN